MKLIIIEILLIPPLKLDFQNTNFLPNLQTTPKVIHYNLHM